MAEWDLAKLTSHQLQKAAANGELSLVYQPKLDLRSHEITGVEALARWEHPIGGQLSPTDFIPLAEASGLVNWFTDWVLTTAARQWVSWKRHGLDLELAINISALNLGSVCFPDLVYQICEEQGLIPQRLTLELTEGATQDAVNLMDTVTRLRLKGIGISLDDFGTGFGSLVHLRSLPFTELKVDRRFVCDLPTSKDSRTITRGLIVMAHELGLTVTAEGIEDHATLDILQVFGCDKAQGFLISRPLAGESVVEWVAHQRAGDLRGPGGADPKQTDDLNQQPRTAVTKQSRI